MVKSASLQIEIILDIWNTLIMVSGDTATNVESLQTKSVGSRLTVLYNKYQCSGDLHVRLTMIKFSQVSIKQLGASIIN